MRPKTIVFLSPALDKDLRFPPCVYNLAIERAIIGTRRAQANNRTAAQLSQSI